ncbi:uncharacterized protein VTP21DRAFT_2884 [Calcarisporiella thermophila]|uniref:uncharacterized protein n=1 Tax=Calcarisporiella thermophila TaxID=911321 RepID=UPI0037445ADE
MLPPEKIVEVSANLLRKEANALMDLANRVESAEMGENYSRSIYRLFRALERGGKIVVTGVGKSGRIGEKLVATLQSTGSCAVFLHAVEALHGDLGLIHSHDVVLALSYSGNTDEILRLLPSIKLRGVTIVGMGGNSNSLLARSSDAWIDTYVESEAYPDIPAPTSSATAMLAMGHAVAMTLAQLRNFSSHHFAMNHPGGSLGRRLLMRVEEIALKEVAMVETDATMDMVMREFTRVHRPGCVLVMETNPRSRSHSPFLPALISSTDFTPPTTPIPKEDDDMTPAEVTTPNRTLPSETTGEPAPLGARLAGIITMGDVRRALEGREKMFHLRASDIMSSDPIICRVDDLACEAKKVMEENGLASKGNPELKKPLPCLPVTDDKNQLVGVVTLKDLLELF